ncbi:MAG: shikimate dehydrogenase [Candidatus Omnitrophica bacterium]|nr:shikimate dehydrogenase [Candidatus Omnitrophota bacterium]MCB9746839.1 shikimate dehydrogenase [Candidatus Omnitrophota bacterium]
MQTDQALYGIIGNPLKHSLSPVMHNAAFKELGVDAVYQLFPLQENELETFFKELHQDTCPIFGLNVTVPYKEKAVQYLDNLSPLVEKLGVTNTIVINKQRKLIGYNTDAPGFLAHLAELDFQTAGKNIVILGAGGSARAILITLCLIPERPASIRIYNRTSSRLDTMLKDIQNRIDISIVEPAISIDDLNIEDADLLINTTSVGLDVDDPCLVDESLLHPRLLVYDLIYNPRETPLLTLAKKQGAEIANGLGMLYYQGVLSFQHWAGIELDEKTKMIMKNSLEEALEGESNHE